MSSSNTSGGDGDDANRYNQQGTEEATAADEAPLQEGSDASNYQSSTSDATQQRGNPRRRFDANITQPGKFLVGEGGDYATYDAERREYVHMSDRKRAEEQQQERAKQPPQRLRRQVDEMRDEDRKTFKKDLTHQRDRRDKQTQAGSEDEQQ